jgi:Fe-S cluster assembly ATPase SufC
MTTPSEETKDEQSPQLMSNIEMLVGHVLGLFVAFNQPATYWAMQDYIYLAYPHVKDFAPNQAKEFDKFLNQAAETYARAEAALKRQIEELPNENFEGLA